MILNPVVPKGVCTPSSHTQRFISIVVVVVVVVIVVVD
jgi:hypothetical protein